MNHARRLIADPDLNLAMWQAADPIVTAAHRLTARLPPITTDEFLTAPLAVRQAALIIAGIGAVHHHEPALESWESYPGGRYHRTHILTGHSELQRRRWPPTGDRDLWVRYGPTGPPTAHRARRSPRPPHRSTPADQR